MAVGSGHRVDAVSDGLEVEANSTLDALPISTSRISAGANREVASGKSRDSRRSSGRTCGAYSGSNTILAYTDMDRSTRIIVTADSAGHIGRSSSVTSNAHSNSRIIQTEAVVTFTTVGGVTPLIAFCIRVGNSNAASHGSLINLVT